MKRLHRRVLVVGLGVLALAAAALHLAYPWPYVVRVFLYQGPDFEDIHRFPSQAIAASPSPRRLPGAFDPRVTGVLEEHPRIRSLEAWLEDTETSAFLVLHRGRLVAEHYGAGYDETSLQNSFSVSKSVTSALVGLAVRDGRLRLGEPVTRYLPELGTRDPRFAEVQLEHLLDMRSGVRFSSKLSFPFVSADPALIYYHPDLESILLRRTTLSGAPGDFQYNNYNPPLLGLVLRRALGTSVVDYLERELWGPLGAEGRAGWTVDDRGLERMEHGFHARARDLARFGQLFLDRGRVGDLQLLPGPWVEMSTRLTEPVELERYDGRSWGYRAGWWIVPRPAGPSDFAAIGHFGQFVYVSPRHQVVFVRNGAGRGEWGDFDWTELFYAAAARLDALDPPQSMARLPSSASIEASAEGDPAPAARTRGEE